jgi:predicted transcriptional regulator of viral defense system
LQTLLKEELIERVERGLYWPVERVWTETTELVQVALRYPRGVFCLLTALSLHSMTTQNPFDFWMSYPKGEHRPVFSMLPVRLFAVHANIFEWGVESREIEGVRVSLTGPARTVADCFKFRRELGLDVALEALKEYIQRGYSLATLREAGKVCRVSTILSPYIEALIA